MTNKDRQGLSIDRRVLLSGSLALASVATLLPPTGSATELPKISATFAFSADIHACLMGSGLSPYCAQEGKTDEALRRHIAAINRLPELFWPDEVAGEPSGLASAGTRIGNPLGLVIGGDMTDDGGGQVTTPEEGRQLMQFSRRYQEGPGPDRVHFPVYVGLGNHDLDQDGPPPHVDWYRRELRDYVEFEHRPSVIFKPTVPVGNYDIYSDNYSWDWGGLHLVQMHRFAGDTRKGAESGIPWLKQDLAAGAADGRPVIIFQHYGWDSFSIERWNPLRRTFDDTGSGHPRWWTEEERKAMLETIADYNVVAIFHGHQHETPMIYKVGDLDLFKPKAAYMGGFAIARVTDTTLDVVLGEARPPHGDVAFTNAFSKAISIGTAGADDMR